MLFSGVAAVLELWLLLLLPPALGSLLGRECLIIFDQRFNLWLVCEDLLGGGGGKLSSFSSGLVSAFSSTGFSEGSSVSTFFSTISASLVSVFTFCCSDISLSGVLWTVTLDSSFRSGLDSSGFSELSLVFISTLGIFSLSCSFSSGSSAWLLSIKSWSSSVNTSSSSKTLLNSSSSTQGEEERVLQALIQLWGFHPPVCIEQGLSGSSGHCSTLNWWCAVQAVLMRLMS